MVTKNVRESALLGMRFSVRFNNILIKKEKQQKDLVGFLGTDADGKAKPTKAAISSWSTGRRVPSRKTLEALAKFFGVEVEYWYEDLDEFGNFVKADEPSSKDFEVIDFKTLMKKNNIVVRGKPLTVQKRIQLLQFADILFGFEYESYDFIREYYGDDVKK